MEHQVVKAQEQRERLEKRWNSGKGGVDSSSSYFEEEKREVDEQLMRAEREMREELEKRRAYRYKTFKEEATSSSSSKVVNQEELKREFEILKDKINPDRVELRLKSSRINTYESQPASTSGKDVLNSLNTGKKIKREQRHGQIGPLTMKIMGFHCAKPRFRQNNTNSNKLKNI